MLTVRDWCLQNGEMQKETKGKKEIYPGSSLFKNTHFLHLSTIFFNHYTKMKRWWSMAFVQVLQVT